MLDEMLSLYSFQVGESFLSYEYFTETIFPVCDYCHNNRHLIPTSLSLSSLPAHFIQNLGIYQFCLHRRAYARSIRRACP
jgi:hypothetical protein